MTWRTWKIKSALAIRARSRSKSGRHLEDYAAASAALARVQSELRTVDDAIADLETRMKAVKAGRLKPATPADIENAVNSDAESLRLHQDSRLSARH